MLGKAWLVAVSLFFYAYWNPAYIYLLLGSILFNFSIGSHLASDFRSRHFPLSRRNILTLSIGVNLALLGYFKYTNFFGRQYQCRTRRRLRGATDIAAIGDQFFYVYANCLSGRQLSWRGQGI